MASRLVSLVALVGVAWVVRRQFAFERAVADDIKEFAASVQEGFDKIGEAFAARDKVAREQARAQQATGRTV